MSTASLLEAPTLLTFLPAHMNSPAPAHQERRLLAACAVLVADGVLNWAQVADGMDMQVDTGLNLGHILACRLNYCSLPQFLEALHRHD